MIPDSPASRMFVEAMLIQDKEVKVYEDLLELLRDTIKKKNATDKIHIKTPRLLYGRCDVGSQYVFSLSSKDENNSSRLVAIKFYPDKYGHHGEFYADPFTEM